MKKFFLYIISIPRAIGTVLKRLYHTIFLGQKLTYKAKRLRDYVYKVAMEDYQPTTMAELEDEACFNPQNWTGEERRMLARAWFLKLAEY